MAALPRIRLVARFGQRRGAGLSPFVMISIAGHVAVTAFLLFLPALTGRRQVPREALVVDLVAPATAAARASPTPPAAPPPGEPPEGVRAAPAEPKPAKKSPPEPTRKPARKPDTKPAVPPVPAPSARPAADRPAEGGSITAIETGDFELAWYRDSVTSALYGRWVKPILEGIGEPYEVSVVFEILRDGRLRNLRIDQTSGIPSFDRSALRAVADAAPFPPLPPAWTKPQLSARFLFRLYPE